MRAAMYLRQSIDATGEGLAVDRQRTDCRNLCRAKGWSAVEYVDNSVSATNGRRPAYQRMLDDIRDGLVEAVVVWDLDRLHRRPIELEEFMALADQRQIALATVTGDVDLATDNGRLFARIKAAVARAEVERKSARQKAATRQRVAHGLPWSSVRPFGFEPDLVTHHPVESQQLRQCYRDINSGISLMEATRRLNAAGATTTKGNPWQRQTLKQTLLRPRYAGFVEHKGQISGRGRWEPVVPEDEWRTAVARLTTGIKLGRRPKGLLSSVALCGICGHHVGRANHNGRPVYICAAVDDDGRALKHVSRRCDYTDQRVTEVILTRLARPDARDILTPDIPDLAPLRAEADRLRGRLEQVAAAYADEEIGLPEWKTARDRIRARLAEVEASMADTSVDPILRPLVEADDPREAWDDLDVDRQRTVIEALVTVTIRRTRLGPRFRPEDVAVEWKR